MGKRGRRSYVLHFCQQHDDFKLPELESVLELEGVDPEAAVCRREAEVSLAEGCPFLAVDLPSDEVTKRVAARMATLLGVVRLWAEGESMEELCSRLRDRASAGELSSDTSSQKTFSIDVRCVGAKRPEAEKNEMRALLVRSAGFQGPVKLKGADIPAALLEDRWLADGENKVRDGGYYFGTYLADGGRASLSSMRLSQRAFLGPTSMDHYLSMIMANMGKVNRGTLVSDPFVGTGSILVACSSLGAVCVGADIDWRILHGSKSGGRLVDNFDQYGLAKPDTVRCDVSLRYAQWREGGVFDALVCDPPYGIRAGARRLPHREGEVKTRPPPPEGEDSETWGELLPRTINYPIDEVLVDLLDVAARSLRIGGRLVYLLPSKWEYDPVKELPGHPCLDLVAHSVQGLTMSQCRRLITMQKVAAYEEGRRGEYIAFTRKGGQARRNRVVQSLPTGADLPAWVCRQMMKGKWGSSERFRGAESQMSARCRSKNISKAKKYSETMKAVHSMTQSGEGETDGG